MKTGLLLLLLGLISCTSLKKTVIPVWTPYDETAELATTNNESPRLRYKLIQSRILDKHELWKNVQGQLRGFTEKDYETLKPLILEQDIPTLQSHVKAGRLSYEKLVQWYLFRIVKFENNKDHYLNNIIAINPDAVAEARKKDRQRKTTNHPIYGMPILLKDNINTAEMATTAGAHALLNNKTRNAFIAQRLQDRGAILLGKTNLSEWANYFCLACPNGYSAVGGQTLNPYGRKKFDTGGSSSGSGSAMAANYAVAAVGTETSGSILSPSSANSVVGLKPTTGLLSRSGIVPISGTLDTPGPMTRNVTDNAILLDALSGIDREDIASKNNPARVNYLAHFKDNSFKGTRFGVYKSFLKDPLYKEGVEKMIALGGTVVEIEAPPVSMEGFGTLLSADMKNDLPAYIQKYGSSSLPYRTIPDIIAFNKKDTSRSIPYGQGRFEEIAKNNISAAELTALKLKLRANGKAYFQKPMDEFQLDAMVSVANWQATQAAAANYPCLTVPMGYRPNGEPAGITFIAGPYKELTLLQLGYVFEQATQLRKMPVGFQ